ncbi:MAG: hypothetical protein P0Y49_04730 [Candidatus Pedobacter colombiensis]|uniref:DUF4935 domain-containing protein n=1 Tax=Candidatus Pedobacter colombiensis TaxID=3121371 RepID=A0AAJ5WD07_9SPHI|nr:PIN domain-containing protein [Pedobacter sp.]WEK20442.1 MAG: hypothetical protein P0Y49_04730 [Pedobacter sp.]
MYNVFLDTNIYRSLGLRFSKHRDYEYLIKFLASSGNEFGLMRIVHEELLDYYKKDVFGKLFSEYQRVIRQFSDNPFLRTMPSPDFELELSEALRVLDLDLNTIGMSLEVKQIPADLLTDFLLFNKAERKGDNARDFLIFYNLISLCQQDPEETVVLISQDKIFSLNEFFREQLKTHSIGNYKVYDSIAAFLADAGPKVNWLTKELIRAAIDPRLIEEEMANDVMCLPSYCSQYYYERGGEDLPPLEKLTIEGFEVKDFYVSKNEKSGKLVLNVDVSVAVYALFGEDPQPDALKAYLADRRVPTISHPETFDDRGQVFYQEKVLFLFQAELNETTEQIENLKFIDFLPSHYRYDDWTPGPAYKLVPLEQRYSLTWK